MDPECSGTTGYQFLSSTRLRQYEEHVQDHAGVSSDPQLGNIVLSRIDRLDSIRGELKHTSGDELVDITGAKPVTNHSRGRM